MLALRVPGAGEKLPVTAGLYRHGTPTLRALGVDWRRGSILVERPRKTTIGVVRAGNEGPVATALDQKPSPAMGTLLVAEVYLGWLIDRPGVAAIGIGRAAEEPPVAIPAHDHRRAAQIADSVVGLNDFLDDFRAPLLTLLQPVSESLVEVAEHLMPLELPFLDAIQTRLHVAGELDIEGVGEDPDQDLDHRLAEGRRREPSALQLDVRPVHER